MLDQLVFQPIKQLDSTQYKSSKQPSSLSRLRINSYYSYKISISAVSLKLNRFKEIVLRDQ